MFYELTTANENKVYNEYTRLTEILTTNEYSDMYSKIGAIRSVMNRIEELMEDEETKE